MQWSRTSLLFACAFLSHSCFAQPVSAYPDRPVRLIVGFPSGSGPDLVGRVLADWLSRRLGQSG